MCPERRRSGFSQCSARFQRCILAGRAKEVDLLIVEGRRILPIEIKLGASISHHAVAGLRQCMKDLGLRRGWVITTARERRRISPEIEIIPWAELASGQG